MSVQPPPSSHPATTPRTWTVGTLTYTRGQLIRVFFWLLLGDFCLHLMDNGVVPSIVPLQFEAAGASKTTYAFVAITVVNLLYTLMTPVLAILSDRHRGKMGRRRPFLLWATPLLAGSLILLGFSTNIGRYVDATFPNLFGDYTLLSWTFTLTATKLTIGLTAALFLIFKFFDAFPQSIYYYMWPDVVPSPLMGMFGALFRVFYAGGSLVFNTFLLEHAKAHPQEIFLGSALLYMFAFLLLCWQVKEPDYPPLPADERGGNAVVRVLRTFGTYFKECFTHPFYLKYYFAMAAFQMGYQPFVNTLIFYGKDIYGDTAEGLKHYGRVLAIKDGLWIAIFLALVPVMMRLHPVHAGVIGYILMTLAAAAGTFFISGPWTFATFTILSFAAVGLFLGGTAAIGPRLLPIAKYGQFASAGALVFRLSVAVVGTFAGIVLDKLGTSYIYAWLLVFLVIGTFLMLSVYRDWKRMGGVSDYVPPEPSRA